MKCASCDKDGAKHRCSGSCCQREQGAAHYCSEACQVNHWGAGGHHKECGAALAPVNVGGAIFNKSQAERQRALLDAQDQSRYQVYDVRARYVTRDWFGSNQRRVLNMTTRVVTEQGFRPVLLNRDGTIKDDAQLECKRVRTPAEFTRARGAPALWCWACTESLDLAAVGESGVSVEQRVFASLLEEPEPEAPPEQPSTTLPLFPGITLVPGRRPRPAPRQPRPSPPPPRRRELPVLPGIVVRVSHDNTDDESDALESEELDE